MKNFLIKYRKLILEMFLYGIIGLTSASVDTIVFYLLTNMAGMHSLYANVISVPIGICISFTLNLFFNFKTKDHIVKRFVSFFAVGMFGLVLSEVILAIGGYQSWDPLITKIASVVIVAIIQFILNKFISFRRGKTEEVK